MSHLWRWTNNYHSCQGYSDRLPELYNISSREQTNAHHFSTYSQMGWRKLSLPSVNLWLRIRKLVPATILQGDSQFRRKDSSQVPPTIIQPHHTGELTRHPPPRCTGAMLYYCPKRRNRFCRTSWLGIPRTSRIHGPQESSTGIRRKVRVRNVLEDRK